MSVQASIADLYYNREINAWHCDIHANARLAALSQRPVFSYCAPEVMDAPNEDTTHWRMFNYVVSRMSKAQRKWASFVQRRGTCGGQGNAGALTMMAAVWCFKYGTPFPGFVSPASQYALARVELGNWVSNQDGVIGAYCSQVPKQRGVLYLDQTLGKPTDYSSPLAFHQQVYADEQLAVKWAAQRSGLPDDMEANLSQFMVDDVIPARTTHEAAKAIQNGNMGVGGSNLIPSGKRNQFGLSNLQSAGGHWTFYGDVRWRDGQLEFLYYQSWEGWGSGPTLPNDQPEGTVWVPADQVQQQLNQNDYYVYVRPKGLTYEPRVRRSTDLLWTGA
jgi:hypothetical protein